MSFNAQAMRYDENDRESTNVEDRRGEVFYCHKIQINHKYQALRLEKGRFESRLQSTLKTVSEIDSVKNCLQATIGYNRFTRLQNELARQYRNLSGMAAVTKMCKMPKNFPAKTIRQFNQRKIASAEAFRVIREAYKSITTLRMQYGGLKPSVCNKN